ncbi:uncharacterized protein QYS62_005549 [Fusarium acuminatum]|uniref:Uncharacterized protein n=1 Tax=Fusarium acuminatum TaxID=5515 RepID=A0ABZ2WVQ8_9HYPO
MSYSSSGPSLAQALDMNMDQYQDQHRSRKSHVYVDPSPSTLAPSNSDLSELHDSRSNNPRLLSHPHYIRNNEVKVEKDVTRNHLHHAHLQLRQIESFDDKTVDQSAEKSHLHLHKTGHHSHSHSHHSHQRLHRSKSPASLHLRAAEPKNADANALKPRAEQNLFTQVVQTVSVVQIVDSAGSPIEVQTHYAAPATVVVDSATGITVAAISDPEPKLSVAAAASVPVVSYNAPSQQPPAAAPTVVEAPSLTDPLPSAIIPDATVSDSVPEPVNDTTLLPTADVQSDTVPPTLEETSIPVTSTNPDTASQETTSPAIPTTAIDTTASEASGSETSFVTTDDLSATTTEATLIETTSDFTSEATQEVTSEATSEETSKATLDATQTESDPATTNTVPTTTGTSSRARSTSTVIVVSSTFITSSINPSDTGSAYSYSDSVYSSISAEQTWSSGWWTDEDSPNGGAGGATADIQPPAATTTSSSNGTDTSTLSPQQKQVIGGVVGSVAGVAFLAFFVLFALRYKKKHPGGGLLGGHETGTRSIGGPMSGPDGGNGSMAERSGASSVMAAAIAGLMGKKQRQTLEPAPAAERGFYRVSGKKLPSVLQVGGDGYSDPRDGPPLAGPPLTGPPPSGRAVRESVMSGHSDYWRGSMAFDPADRDSHHLALGSPMRPISGVPVIRSGPARTPITESNPFTDPRPRPDSDALGGSTGGASIASHESPSRFQERI